MKKHLLKKAVCVLLIAFILSPICTIYTSAGAKPINQIKIGDFIRFGIGDDNANINTWQVINIKDNDVMLLNTMSFTGEYDASVHALSVSKGLSKYLVYGSATWEYSDARQWLNNHEENVFSDAEFSYDDSGIAEVHANTDKEPSYAKAYGYLSNVFFTEAEYWLIDNTEHYSLIPSTQHNDPSVYLSEYSKKLDYTLYDGSYGVDSTTEKMFILNGYEFNNYVDANALCSFRAPNNSRYSSCYLRDSVVYDYLGFYTYVGTHIVTVNNGRYEAEQADMKKGFRPACYINFRYVLSLNGSGTFDDPYGLDIDPSVVGRKVNTVRDYPEELIGDTFSFINCDQKYDARGGFDENRKSKLNSYYKTVFSKVYGPVMSNYIFAKYAVFPWTGSCFGMSAVYALKYRGMLDVSYFQNDANCLYDLEKPIDNDDVYQMITFYHLIQDAESDFSIWDNVFKHTLGRYSVMTEEVIKRLKTSEFPIVLGIFMGGSSEHAVVARSMTETDDEYVIKIWDPNISGYDIIHVSKDFEDVELESGRYWIRGLMTSYNVEYFPNLQMQCVNYDRDHGKDEKLITTDLDSFTITSGGTQTIVQNGKVVSGDYVKSDAINVACDGDESQPFYVYVIENLPDDRHPICMHTDTKGEHLFGLINQDEDDSNNDYYSYALFDGGCTLTFGNGNGIEVQMPESGTSTVSYIGYDENRNDWLQFNVSGSGNSFGARIDGEKVIIGGEYSDLKIEIGTDMEITDIGTIVGADNGASVEITDNSYVVKNSKGTVVAEKDLEHMIFFDLGDIRMDPIEHIPHGTIVSAPADPHMDELIFDGWYTSSSFEEGTKWDFSQIVMNDIVLYAKWKDPYVRGDVNGDGSTNSADAIYLLRHTMRASKYPINQSGDVNGDGDTNSADAIYLLRYTIRPSKYPLAD